MRLSRTLLGSCRVGIVNIAVRLNNGTFAENCVLFSTGNHKMNNLMPSRQKIVGNQAPMTAPPHSFGTHERNRQIRSEIFQLA